jgi:hypothetical protein
MLLLCRVLWPQHSAKKLYRFPSVTSLPSVVAFTLGKVSLCECYTRQSDQNTTFLFVFVVPSKQTKDISHNHHTYITYITES